jgi:hypothetical protein
VKKNRNGVKKTSLMAVVFVEFFYQPHVLEIHESSFVQSVRIFCIYFQFVSRKMLNGYLYLLASVQDLVCGAISQNHFHHHLAVSLL